MTILLTASTFYPPFIRRQFTKSASLYREFSGNRVSEHLGLLKVNAEFREMMANREKQHLMEEFCSSQSLDRNVLEMSLDAANSLHETMVRLLALQEKFLSTKNAPDISDSRIDLLLSVVTAAYYPNICQIEYGHFHHSSEQLCLHLTI